MAGLYSCSNSNLQVCRCPHALANCSAVSPSAFCSSSFGAGFADRSARAMPNCASALPRPQAIISVVMSRRLCAGKKKTMRIENYTNLQYALVRNALLLPKEQHADEHLLALHIVAHPARHLVE